MISEFSKFIKRHGETDEWETPEEAVKIVERFVRRDWAVWCPFDKPTSHFVKVLSKNGHSVINTHIDNGQDFFTEECPECDCIVSNPPYSVRNKVLSRLFEIGKPFAMLLNSVGVFEYERHRMFKEHGVQILVPNKRIRFFNSSRNARSAPPFQSWYVCWKFLPKDIVFCDL